MKYTIPHYFEQFRCTAAECVDTCCAGWAIMIDEKSLEKYKNTEGALGNRLHNSIDWEEGSFQQYEKRCAFLNEENLCDLHLEGGEEMLCDTCRNYPRHMEEFDGLREGSLSLSCIEAAKIILGCKDPVQFITMEDDTEDEEDEEFDFLLFTKLMDAREAILKMLQNREVDICVRMGMVLNLSKEIQIAVDHGELFQIDELLKDFGEMDSLLEMQKQIGEDPMGENEYCSEMRKMFRTFSKLEVLKEDWPEYVRKAERLLFGEGQREYLERRKAFHKAIGLKSASYDVWSCLLEQLMVYFVFTYFCGAVYDDHILGKMQTAVVSTILIQELAQAVWQEKQETFTFMDFVDVAHRYSREIEHSDINLLRLEKLFDRLPLFQPKQLIRILSV